MDKEVITAIKKALAALNPHLDKLTAKGKAAVEALAALVGYGSAKGDLSAEDLQTAALAISCFVDGFMDEDGVSQEASLLTADEVKLLKSLLEKIEKLLSKDYGYGTPDAKTAKTQESMTRIVQEAVELSEPVEGSEGLSWKACLIKAGLSQNYKYYPPDLLKASVKTFDGLRAFEDHSATDNPAARSVHDLSGWYSDPEWDEGMGPEGAVVGIYHALEAAESTKKIREAWERGKKDLTGFSITAIGTGKQRMYENRPVWWIEDLKPLSVDIVTSPAAGGEFLDLLAEARYQKEFVLLESLRAEPEPGPATQKLEPGLDGGAGFNGGNQTMDPETIEKMKVLEQKVRLMECQATLRRELEGSGLPVVLQEQVSTQFENRVFGTDELETAITRTKAAYLAASDEHRKKQPTVKVTFDSKDKVAAGIKGMILEEMVDGVQPFRSLHQAFLTYHNMSTYDFGKDQLGRMILREMQTYDSGDVLRLEEEVSFPVLLGDALHVRLLKEWETVGYDDWRKVVSSIVPLEDLNPQNPATISYLGPLPQVAQGGTYQNLGDLTEQAVVWTPAKYGGTINWTWEDAVNDRLNVLRRIPRTLARTGKMTIYFFVFDMLPANAVMGYDSVALFNALHGNRGTTALASASFSAAKLAMKKQTALGTNNDYLAAPPRYVVVPANLSETAVELTTSDFFVDPSNPDSQRPNPHKSRPGALLDVIEVVYWTDTNDWFLVTDPAQAPTIEIGFLNGRETPDILAEAANAGSSFYADAVVWKIRLVFGGGPVDHRGMYGAFVT